MGAENSKGKGTTENSLLDEVTSEDLKNLQDLNREVNIDEAEIVNLALDENAAKVGGTSNNGIVVNDTNLDGKNENHAEDGDGVEEERVIEIDEYTRKLTIIQENVYHYVGLVSGSEYAREMGIEIGKNNLPQAPIEFLLQRKAKQRAPQFLLSSQPEQKAFEHENPDKNRRSLEKPNDERSLGQDTANDTEDSNSCEEKLIKEDESGILEKNTAGKIGANSQILEAETFTESIALTVKSNESDSGELLEDDGEKDKATQNESTKITDANGDELKSKESKTVSNDINLDEATDVKQLDSVCPSLNSHRKPRAGQAETEEDTNTQSHDDQAILPELSGDTKLGLNANASKYNEETGLGSQARATGKDFSRRDSADKRKTTLPILKQSIPDASGRSKSSPKSTHGAATMAGSRSKIAKSIGSDDKQKNTSVAMNDKKKSDLYEAKYKLSPEDVIEQGDAMQVGLSSRSSVEGILISDLESDRNADARMTVENDNALKSSDGDFESCQKATEEQRSSLRNSKDSENRNDPATDEASNDYSLTKTEPVSTQDTSDSTSTYQEDEKRQSEKPVNDEAMVNKLNKDEANSNADDFGGSPLGSDSTKTIDTAAETQMTFPTGSFDSSANDPVELKDTNPDVQGISQDQQKKQRPSSKSVGRTVSICDSVSLISEDDGHAVLAKRKSLARSRSVGFRDPEFIPDTVRPTKIRVPIASASVRDPLKPTSADGKTKIPLTSRKTCPQIVPIKTPSSVQENKSPLTPNESPSKTPSRPAASRPALVRSKTVQEPATRRRSATTTPPAAASIDHSRALIPSALYRTTSVSKVTRTKADSDATVKKPCSKSMESSPRCTCRQKSGSSLARSLSTTTDPVKHETSANQKLCRSLSHSSHEDGNPVG